MTKYTINKVFDKTFPYPIWKIQVDSFENNIAIEYRNPTDTLPTFSVYSFDGNLRLEGIEVNEKEWTLEALRGDYLILKKYGSTSPIQAGIKIIHLPSSTIVSTYSEYVLQEVHHHTIIASHRSIPSGLLFYIDLKTGKVSNSPVLEETSIFSHILYPVPFQGKMPLFMANVSAEGDIWIQRVSEDFLWTYHRKTNNGYELDMILSSREEILDQVTVLKELDKLIPQPYFSVNNYIFFLSNTKQEITTYLV